MNRIIDVPIEALPERYSADWQRWFQNEYHRLQISFYRVNPLPISQTISQGSFLDVIGTNYYKSMQIAGICDMFYRKEITNDDVFLFHDAWHSGIEQLAYIRDGLGMKFKITGCLHAGSYDPYDFLAKKGMGYWAEDIENGWFKIIDKIFVATNFHKRLLTTTREVDPKKIIVTGFPIYYEGKHLPKEKIVVFPHRLDEEKNPQLFDLAKEFIHQKGHTEWKFIRTKDVCSTKEEYYNILERAAISVSFADQETWGIAMQESLFAGCGLLVPDRLSYPEMYDPCFLYSGIDNFASSLLILVTHFGEVMKNSRKENVVEANRAILLKKGSEAIENMIKECASC